MTHGEIEREVVSFILEEIESVPHLEALLLLWQPGGRAWTGEALAARIYVPGQEARAILEDLTRRGFLEQRADSPRADSPRADSPRYVANANWPGARSLLPRLLEAHRKHLVRITALIHSKAAAPVREFARAFEIKKDN